MKMIMMICGGIIAIAVMIMLYKSYKVHQIKQKRKSKNDLDGMFLLHEQDHKH